MFDHDHHGPGRQRGPDLRGGDVGRQFREELRRSLRGGAGRRGAGQRDVTFGDFFGRGRPGPAVRRGEIRPLILAVLQQKPMHGYEVIQELEAQSGGRWRPSAGSVYPTLQQLADEGLVTSIEVDGRRTYTLTDAGRLAAADTGTRSPWTESEDDQQPDMGRLALQVAGAVMQVQKMGTPRARREAARILTETRKQMYRLLSEDEDASADDEASPA